MNLQTQSLDRRSFLSIERFGIWGLLVLIALVRLPFWPGARALRDGIAYSIGALITHVAHPPGSIGYCLLGGWVDQLVGNAETSFIYINLIAGLVATYLCYRVALAAGLSVIGALLAAAAYGLSINTLTAALTIAPHLLEGVGTFVVAWFGLLAIQQRKSRFAIGCTLATGLVGAMRPTATLFLLPLWAYCIYASLGSARRKLVVVATHAALLLVISVTWTLGNSYYMTQAGYGGTTYEKQVLTVAPYDYVSMSTDVRTTTLRHTFHMPAAEVLAWLEPRLHVRLLPHIPDWPTASLSRATRLAGQQLIKQATFLAISMPVMGLAAIVFVWPKRIASKLNRRVWMVLTLWFVPAALFFVVGHLGTLTYLQSYLGAVAIASAAIITTPINAVRNERPLLVIAFSGALTSGLIFVLGKPITTSNSKLNLVNVALLQYTGPAKSAGYGAARVSGALETEPTNDPTADADYMAADTDAKLISAARKHHFEYLNPRDLPPTTLPAN